MSTKLVHGVARGLTCPRAPAAVLVGIPWSLFVACVDGRANQRAAGPIAGPKVAVMLKPARPTGRFDGGNIEMMMVKPSGINTPPVKPCNARKTIISLRL